MHAHAHSHAAAARRNVGRGGRCAVRGAVNVRGGMLWQAGCTQACSMRRVPRNAGPRGLLWAPQLPHGRCNEALRWKHTCVSGVAAHAVWEASKSMRSMSGGMAQAISLCAHAGDDASRPAAHLSRPARPSSPCPSCQQPGAPRRCGGRGGRAQPRRPCAPRGHQGPASWSCLRVRTRRAAEGRDQCSGMLGCKAKAHRREMGRKECT